MINKNNFYSKSYIHKKRKKSFFKFLIIVLVLLSTLFVLVYLFNNFGIIKKIDVRGAKISDKDQIIEFAENTLNKKSFFILSKRNFLIYPKDKLKKELQNSFYSIKNIDFKIEIDEKGEKFVVIEIEDKKPEALKCLDENNCLYADKDGSVFAKAPEFSDSVFIKFFSQLPVPSLPASSGLIDISPVNSSIKFTDLMNFAENLKKINIETKKVIYQENNNFTFLVEKKNDLINNKPDKKDDWDTSILFNDKYSLDEIYNNLDSVLKKYPTNKIIEYIDLRFGDNVVIKPL